MSRIGKKIIEIPAGVEVNKKDLLDQNGVQLKVKGPLGELCRDFRNEIDIIVGENTIKTLLKKSSPFSNALWGTYSSHISNMVDGVTKGFEKKLIVDGIGFKVGVQGKNLQMSLGFSHQVEVAISDDLKVEVEKNVIKISGIDKEKVGSFAAKIKGLKKPEPYKGKGIRYEGEIIRRKEGKKAVSAG